MDDGSNLYRVTVRYYAEIQQYDVFELEASDLREAMARAAERFPDRALGSADLVEVRMANPVT